MITTHLSPTTEKFECYGFKLTRGANVDWFPKQREIANIIQDDKTPYVAFAAVHLNNFWLFTRHAGPLDIMRAHTRIVSKLAHVFLSRIHLHTYVHPDNAIEFVRKQIDVDAHKLFTDLHLQTDLFTEAPEFELLREDLRTGLWIT